MDTVGSFLTLVPQPLGLGSVELEDGRWVKGFICEPHALGGALDISAHGGWRAWLESR
jgi:allophanate hydrolase